MNGNETPDNLSDYEAEEEKEVEDIQDDIEVVISGTPSRAPSFQLGKVPPSGLKLCRCEGGVLV
jgi:hypothetical protein